MAIYTKKGDEGESSTLNGKIIGKDSLVFEILGTIDEVNSMLGVAAAFLDEQYLRNKINQVQRTLFKLGSIVAGSKLTIPTVIIKKYEKEIDEWDSALPTLKNFIYPGGSKPSAFLFSARTIVRKLERMIVKLHKERNFSPSILVYVNRLSDYLFTLARYINFRKKIKETVVS